jgi:hypothetical protein
MLLIHWMNSWRLEPVAVINVFCDGLAVMYVHQCNGQLGLYIGILTLNLVWLVLCEGKVDVFQEHLVKLMMASSKLMI